jgi:anti-sigma factor RsiW
VILARLLSGAKHLRLRRRASLLAAGVLEGVEREETLAHLESCARCRAEHDSLRAVVAAMEGDPLRAAEPGVPLDFLVGRVLSHGCAGVEVPGQALDLLRGQPELGSPEDG